jgi:hypothetical protein
MKAEAKRWRSSSAIQRQAELEAEALGVQGLAKQRRVVAVCGGAHYPERDALGVDCYRAFDASLSPVYRAPLGLLAPARGLGDATIDGYLREFQPDGPVVGFKCHEVGNVDR